MNNQEIMKQNLAESMQAWERNWQREIRYSSHRGELSEIYQSRKPFNDMRRSNLPAFSFALPEINMNKIRKECKEIIAEDPEHLRAVKTQNGYPNQNGLWKEYTIYAPVRSRSLYPWVRAGMAFPTGNAFKPDEYDYETTFDPRHTELTKLISLYAFRKRPITIEVLEPQGHIGLQTDVSQNKWNLNKCKLAVDWSNNVNLVNTKYGQLPMQLREMTFWNTATPYCTNNPSHTPGGDTAISINMPIALTNDSIKDKVNQAVREKIASLLG